MAQGAHSPTKTTTKSETNEPELGKFFYGCFLLGWLVIAFGAWTMFKHKVADNPTYTFELGFGANIIHDAVFAPVVAVAGYLLGRVIPRPIKGPVNWGIFSSFVVGVVAYPAVRGFGRKADNLTLLPLNYATALISVLCVIWSIVVLFIFVGVARSERAARLRRGTGPARHETQREVPSA